MAPASCFSPPTFSPRVDFAGLPDVFFVLPVTPAVAEPLPGWVDNMNGPTGVLIGAGKGVIRSMICNGELKSEVIPVDIAINGLILLPYHNSLAEKR